MILRILEIYSQTQIIVLGIVTDKNTKYTDFLESIAKTTPAIKNILDCLELVDEVFITDTILRPGVYIMTIIDPGDEF